MVFSRDELNRMRWALSSYTRELSEKKRIYENRSTWDSGIYQEHYSREYKMCQLEYIKASELDCKLMEVLMSDSVLVERPEKEDVL